MSSEVPTRFLPGVGGTRSLLTSYAAANTERDREADDKKTRSPRVSHGTRVPRPIFSTSGTPPSLSKDNKILQQIRLLRQECEAREKAKRSPRVSHLTRVPRSTLLKNRKADDKETGSPRVSHLTRVPKLTFSKSGIQPSLSRDHKLARKLRLLKQDHEARNQETRVPGVPYVRRILKPTAATPGGLVETPQWVRDIPTPKGAAAAVEGQDETSDVLAQFNQGEDRLAMRTPLPATPIARGIGTDSQGRARSSSSDTMSPVDWTELQQKLDPLRVAMGLGETAPSPPKGLFSPKQAGARQGTANGDEASPALEGGGEKTPHTLPSSPAHYSQESPITPLIFPDLGGQLGVVTSPDSTSSLGDQPENGEEVEELESDSVSPFGGSHKGVDEEAMLRSPPPVPRSPEGALENALIEPGSPQQSGDATEGLETEASSMESTPLHSPVHSSLPFQEEPLPGSPLMADKAKKETIESKVSDRKSVNPQEDPPAPSAPTTVPSEKENHPPSREPKKPFLIVQVFQGVASFVEKAVTFVVDQVKWVFGKLWGLFFS